MNNRDKDKVKVLISEAKVWVDSHSSNTGYWYTDDEGRQVPARYLTTEAIKRMLENLKLKLLKDDDPNEDNSKPRICPVCGSRKVEPVVSPGAWCYYPTSAHIECGDCGLRSKEFDGKDDCDDDGAIRKATEAWNKGRVEPC